MRKSFFITALLIAAALVFLLTLALNQYQLYGQHEKIISQTENFSFQYSTIREQIIEDILDGKLNELSEISSSVEKLHNKIIKILDNSLIPAQYKFTFLQQIDLPGLVLLLRKTTTEKNNKNLLHLINQETRVIGERFMLFERLVLGFSKQKLVDFQAIIIGILAIVVFLVTTLMVITYKLLIIPLTSLSLQTEQVLHGQQTKVIQNEGWKEVVNLALKINKVLADLRREQKLAERFQRVLNCSRNVLEKIHTIKEKDELYHAVCKALLTNHDYVISWIGILDPEGKGISPVAADGSSTMTGGECQECFGAILAATEGDTDPSDQTMQTGETVIMKDILADAPQGPFKNTALADGTVDSISLPLSFANENFGVLTIYVIAQDGIFDLEANLLAEIATTLAVKLYDLTVQKKLLLEKKAKNLIGEHHDIIAFTLDKSGSILTVESYLSGPQYKDKSLNWVGSPITDIVIPRNDTEIIVFNNSLVEGKRYDFNAGLAGFDDTYSALLAPADEGLEDERRFLLVLVPPPKNLLLQPENFQIAYAAAIGQFAGSMAHEITDVCNGIINYAQMVSDEIQDNENIERKKILSRIVFGGEKVAAVVEPLLVDPSDIEFSHYDENIHKVFDDILLLVGHLFKKDGIAVHLDVQTTSLTCNRQHLQLILLTLLNRLRETLNRCYPNKDPDKSLAISVSQFNEQSKSMLMVEIAFSLRNGEYEEGPKQEVKIAGLWLVQQLARNLGGTIKYDCTEIKHIKINLVLPL